MKKNIAPENQSAIVILGMDRCGTSLCTNVLQALGMSIGTKLLPANRFNKQGYFEDLEILRVHERILAVLGRNWDTLATVCPFPRLWWQSELMEGFYNELTEITRVRTATAGSGRWGFKDPRTVFLLPLWRRVFSDLAIDPVFVVCVRHPGAVAQSLSTRDGSPPLFSEMLWLEKTLGACQASWNAPNCLIHYEDWFIHPSKCVETLLEATGLKPCENAETIKKGVDSIVKRELRHDNDSVPIESRAAKILYQKLQDCCRVPDLQILSTFDMALEVAKEFIGCVEKIAGLKLAGGRRPPPYSSCTEPDFRMIERESLGAVDFFRQHDPVLVQMQWMLAEEERQLVQSRDGLALMETLIAERDALRKRQIESLARAEGLVLVRTEQQRADAEHAAVLKSQATELRDRVAELEIQVADWAHRTRALEAEVRDHENNIAVNRETLNTKEHALAQLRHEKSKLEADLRLHENTIGINQQTLNELRHEKSELDADLRLHENTIAINQRALNEVRRELFDVRSSLSWKFTLPMRGAAAFLAKLHRWVLELLYCTAAFRFAGKPLAKVISLAKFPAGTFFLPQNPLFDADFYKRENSDATRRSKNLWAHYIGFGGDEGRDPHPLFNTKYYKTRYFDVAESGLNPLMHYFKIGASEKRRPHPDFDPAFYLEQYSDVRESRFDPLLHYWHFGRYEGRQATHT